MEGFPSAPSGAGVPLWCSCQCRRYKRCRFDPWLRKIPWDREWQPTPVFLPGKIPWIEEPTVRGVAKSWTRLKQLHVHTCVADGAHSFIFAFSRHITKMKKKSVSTKTLKRMGENVTADRDVKTFIRCNSIQ